LTDHDSLLACSSLAAGIVTDIEFLSGLQN
jgi:hypothetical protein